MHAVQNKQNLVYLNPTITFRDQQTTLTGVTGGNKVFMTTLANPYLNYVERTTPLESDTTYEFQIISVDNLENESVAVQGNVGIPEYVMFPRFLNYVYLPMYEDNTYARGEQKLDNPEFETDLSNWLFDTNIGEIWDGGVAQLTVLNAAVPNLQMYQGYLTSNSGWYQVEFKTNYVNAVDPHIIIIPNGGGVRPVEELISSVPGTYYYSFYYDDSQGDGTGFQVTIEFVTPTVGERVFVDFCRVYELHKNVTPVMLSWTDPVDGEPDQYNIYSNNGSGEIDDIHVYATAAGTENSVNLLLNDNLNWLLKVEASRNGIVSNTKFAVDILTPSTIVPPPSPITSQNIIDVVVDPITGETINSSGNSPDDETGEIVVTDTEPLEGVTTTQVPASFSGVSSTNVNAGKIKVQFIWIYGSLAANFRIYHDNGTGVIDYNNSIQFDRINSIVQVHTTDQIYFGFDDKEFRFVIRSVSQFGVEDTNTVEHRVLLDGTPPDEVENLIIETDI